MPNISGCTKTICLIGSPVEHSLSPAMHTFSFNSLVSIAYTLLTMLNLISSKLL